MSMDFRSKRQKVQSREDIIVAGKVYGDVRSYVDEDGERQLRYHAALNMCGGMHGLIQGFGLTREEAVLDALKNGRSDAELLLGSIDDFEKILQHEA